MNTKTYIEESDRDGGLLINVIPSDDDLTFEVSDPSSANRVSVVIFTANKVSLLELLKKVVDECLLRVKDEESKGERDDA